MHLDYEIFFMVGKSMSGCCISNYSRVMYLLNLSSILGLSNPKHTLGIKYLKGVRGSCNMMKKLWGVFRTGESGNMKF